MKTILKTSLLSLAVATAAYSASYEYPQLFKDPKIMGMGGANIATGGQTTSLFYNTAGLSKIPADYGWEVEVLNFSVSANDNIGDFIQDLDDADSTGDRNNDGKVDDTDKNEATLEVIEKYLGKNNHVSINGALLSVGKKFEDYAIGVVPFGGFIMNLKPHSGFGGEGIVETNGMAYGGVAVGVSRDLKNVEFGDYILNDFSVGVGVKSVSYSVWNHNLTVSELVDNNDDLGKYLEDNVAKDGSSAVLDLGVQYEVYPDVQVGVALQNIGGVGDSEGLEIPMTLGVGIGYTKRLPDEVLFNEIRVAADYIDVLGEYDQDDDFMKRTRVGVTGKFVEGWAGELALQAGMYQGYMTAGFEARIFAATLSYATYSEEVGAYSGQDDDRRHIFNLTVGF